MSKPYPLRFMVYRRDPEGLRPWDGPMTRADARALAKVRQASDPAHRYVVGKWGEELGDD